MKMPTPDFSAPPHDAGRPAVANRPHARPPTRREHRSERLDQLLDTLSES
jgi:hypothetical protein